MCTAEQTERSGAENTQDKDHIFFFRAREFWEPSRDISTLLRRSIGRKSIKWFFSLQLADSGAGSRHVCLQGSQGNWSMQAVSCWMLMKNTDKKYTKNAKKQVLEWWFEPGVWFCFFQSLPNTHTLSLSLPCPCMFPDFKGFSVTSPKSSLREP